MDITPLVKADAQVIQSYADGRFRVSGIVYEGPVIVMAEMTSAWAFYGDVGALSEEDFSYLLEQADDIDVVLLGCGPKIQFLEPSLRTALKNNGLAVDVMDTGAACRTYNVLMAEGRRVVAVLLPS